MTFRVSICDEDLSWREMFDGRINSLDYIY